MGPRHGTGPTPQPGGGLGGRPPAPGDRQQRKEQGCRPVDDRAEHILEGIDLMNVAQSQTPQHGQHQNADAGPEIPPVNSHQKLHSPRQAHRARGRCCDVGLVKGGTKRLFGHPRRKCRLQSKQGSGRKDEPRHQGSKPGGGQNEHKQRPAESPQSARQEQRTGPERLVRPLTAVGPGRGESPRPQADGARGIGCHEAGRIGGENGGQNRKGENGAPARHGIDGGCHERDRGQQHPASPARERAVLTRPTRHGGQAGRGCVHQDHHDHGASAPAGSAP